MHSTAEMQTREKLTAISTQRDGGVDKSAVSAIVCTTGAIFMTKENRHYPPDISKPQLNTEGERGQPLTK